MNGITLRPATESDCDDVYAWASDPVTRNASFHSTPIARETHLAWYARALEGKERRLFVAEQDGKKLGLARFDLGSRATEAEIGIVIAPEHRGQKLASSMLLCASEQALHLGIRKLVARIKPDNAPSLQAFERAGYRAVGEETVAGSAARRYELVLEAG